MPSLSSLPSPATANLPNFYDPNKNSKNRWNALPRSEQALMELINSDGRAATATTQNTSAAVDLGMPNKTALQFPRVLSKKEYVHLGELLRQEHLAGSSQILCHYRNSSLSSSVDDRRSSSISLICELGCCPDVAGGCCTLNEPDEKSATSYHWVMVLLCMFIIAVFISMLAMFVLYWSNRRRERQLLRRRMLMSEKCFSVLSSSPEANYATSSVTTAADGSHFRRQQQPFSPKFWHFFNQPSPTPSPASVLRLDQIHQLSQHHHRHHQHCCHHQHQQQQQQQRHLHSPTSSSSSPYHAPAEMYFRSAL